jgi:hypothetical protein
MCACGQNKPREVWTSAQAQAEAARRERDALIASQQNANSQANAMSNVGG